MSKPFLKGNKMEIKIAYNHIEITNCTYPNRIREDLRALSCSVETVIDYVSMTIYIEDTFSKLYRILYFITNTYCEDIERVY